MPDIPLEYFLSLPQANADGEIVDARNLPAEIAQALHALQISDEQLSVLREQRFQNIRLQHAHILKSYKRVKQKAQSCLRKARSRQAVYPENAACQQKSLDKLERLIRLRRGAFQAQEQQAQEWLPPYYQEERFDAQALRQTVRRCLRELIPSFVEEVGWINQDGTMTPSPHSSELNKEDLKKDETFRDLVTDLYEAFCYWCPPQRKEAEVFAKMLPDISHAFRLRYNKEAEDLTVAVINHAVPNVRYTPSDLRYIFPREKLTKKQRIPLPNPEPFPTNTSSEDLEDIRQKTYEASLFDPYAL